MARHSGRKVKSNRLEARRNGMKDGYPFRSINDLREEDQEIIGNMIIKARDIAQSQGIAESGYKIHINAERGGGQVVFHLHMHLFGGWHDKPHHL